MQQTLLVTVQGTRRKLDIELPGDVPVGELLPLLLQICGISRPDASKWAVSMSSTGRVLQAKRTLSESRVFDGEILLLRRADGAVRQGEALHRERRQQLPATQDGPIKITWERHPLS